MSAISELLAAKKVHAYGVRHDVRGCPWHDVYAFETAKKRTAAFSEPGPDLEFDEVPRWTVTTVAKVLGVPVEFMRRELQRLDKRANQNGDFWTMDEIEAAAATERVQKFVVRVIQQS